MKSKLPRPKNSKNIHHWVLGAFLLSNLIWAAAGPVVILTVQFLPPVEFLFYRFLITCIILLPIVVWELHKTHNNLKDMPSLILLGLLGYGSLIFLFEGLKYTSAIDAAIIGIIAPVIDAFAGNYFYKEKISQRYKLGVTLAILGTLFVVIEPALSHSASDIPIDERIYGNVLVLIYSICLALYLVLSKEMMGKNSSRLNLVLAKAGIRKNSHSYSPFMHTALSFFVALGFYTVLFIVKMFGNPGETVTATEIIQMDQKVMFGLLYMALLSGITAYSLMNWALQRSTVSYSAVFTYLSPVLTLPFAYFMLGELPTVPAVIGSIVIGVGVIIAEYTPKHKAYQ